MRRFVWITGTRSASSSTTVPMVIPQTGQILCEISQCSTAIGAAAIALYAALAAVLGVGVGALLRHSAGAVSVLLLWPLLLGNGLGAMLLGSIFPVAL